MKGTLIAEAAYDKITGDPSKPRPSQEKEGKSHAGVIINMGAVKVNSATFANRVSIGIGRNIHIRQSTVTKSNTGGASVVGDISPAETSTVFAINNDPAFVDQNQSY